MKIRFQAESRIFSSVFQLILKLILNSSAVDAVDENLLFWKSQMPTPLSLMNELHYWKVHYSQKEELSTNLIECLRQCNRNAFPNIYELLCIGCDSPVIGSFWGWTFILRLKTVEDIYKKYMIMYLKNRMTVERPMPLSHIHNFYYDKARFCNYFESQRRRIYIRGQSWYTVTHHSGT